MKVSRNAPCPCGSGKKFKKCCDAAAIIPDSSKAKYPDYFITNVVPERHDIPEFSLEYFHALEVEDFTAPKFLYACLRNPKLETAVEEYSRTTLSRGRAEAERIKRCLTTAELAEMMKKGIDTLNHVQFRSRMLEHPEAAISLIVNELRSSMQTDFIELSARIIVHSKVEISDQLMEIIETHDKSAYHISVLCLVLGFMDNPASAPFLWKYFNYLRTAFPEETYWLAPFYALWEIWARKNIDGKDETIDRSVRRVFDPEEPAGGLAQCAHEISPFRRCH